MRRSVGAELLIVRKRASTWVLLGIWAALALLFAYVIPYIQFHNGSADAPRLGELLPQGIVGNLLDGFPFFGGVFALILGVLAVGSEYGFGTLRTLFTQRPGRLHVFAAKLLALAVALVPFILAVFAVGALASTAIGLHEHANLAWPSAWLLVRGFAAAWLILAVWAAVGVMLAVLSRGTAIAIGVGILYALVIEGLLSALASQVSALDRLVDLFIRINAYSLVAPLGVSIARAENNGPGFAGLLVGVDHALIVLAAYLCGCLALAALLLRRRDVA